MKRFGRLTLLAGAAIVVSSVFTFAGQTTAPAPASRAAAQARPAAGANQLPRTADGKPDFSGIWQALNTAAWDIQDHNSSLAGYLGVPPGRGVVEGNEIPYKPEALAKKKQNLQNRMKVDVSNDKTWHDLGDPEFKCYMPGLPRATYMPFPFQIVQGTSPYILMAYEFATATRTIRMDWKGEAPTDTWMGWSRGRWEGETLVVDVTGQREESWFDRAGDYHSDALHVVERFTPASPYHMMYEATIEDPKVFTRPWKISFPLYRRMERNVQALEFKCVPWTEELLYGKFKKPS